MQVTTVTPASVTDPAAFAEDFTVECLTQEPDLEAMPGTCICWTEAAHGGR